MKQHGPVFPQLLGFFLIQLVAEEENKAKSTQKEPGVKTKVNTCTCVFISWALL